MVKSIFGLNIHVTQTQNLILICAFTLQYKYCWLALSRSFFCKCWVSPSDQIVILSAVLYCFLSLKEIISGKSFPQAALFIRTYHSLMDATLTYIYHLLFTAALPQFISTMEQHLELGETFRVFLIFSILNKKIENSHENFGQIWFDPIAWMRAEC